MRSNEGVTVIIGAGVVGLAIARELAERGDDVVILERHPGPGRETSGHNSQVIHAGIYYPPGSLKASLCVEGKNALYQFCTEFGIPHQRCGKLVVVRYGVQEEHAVGGKPCRPKATKLRRSPKRAGRR